MLLVRSLSTPSRSFTASLRSTILLTFTKKSRASACASAHDCMCKYSRLEENAIRSLPSLSGSITASLRSTNSPMFTKKSRKHANYLFSRSCLLFADNAIIVIGPHLLACTRTSARVHTSVSTYEHACVEGAFCTRMQCPRPHESLSCYSHEFVKLPMSSTVRQHDSLLFHHILIT